jgi:hypothetical protein
MSPRHLKSLVESGHYKPEPALVAEAMLQRRGIRELLMETVAGSGSTGRSPSAPAGGPHQS